MACYCIEFYYYLHINNISKISNIDNQSIVFQESLASLNGSSRGCGYIEVHIKLSEEARAHAASGRAVVDSIMASGEVAYGINTGFGLFANVRVSDEQLRELQEIPQTGSY